MANTAENPTTNSEIKARPPSPLLDYFEFLPIDATFTQKVPAITVPPITAFVVDMDDGKLSTSTQTLARKKGYYIVPCLDQFSYFKIGEIVPKGDYLFELIGKHPPVLREGLVVIDKDVYYVTVQDLQKSLIRKSRKLKLKRGSITYEDFITGNAFLEKTPSSSDLGESSNSSISGPTESPGPKDITNKVRVSSQSNSSGQGGNRAKVSDNPLADIFRKIKNRRHPAAGQTVELDESEIIDLAFKEQVGTLLGDVSEEAGSSWEEWEITEAPQS